MSTSEQRPDVIAVQLEIPRGAPDQWRALTALATGFGWRMQGIPAGELGEIPATPAPADEITEAATAPAETEVVTDQTFEQVSSELFGSPVYGQSAAELMRQYRQQVNGHRIAYSGECSWNNRNTRTGYFDPIFDPADELPAAQLKQTAQEFWDSRHYPFEMVFSDQRSLSPWEKVVSLLPGRMTRDRLVSHLTARGLPQHNLHGSLGKIFDVYNVAAGVTDRANIGNTTLDPATEFITRTDLLALVDSAGYGSRQRNVVLDSLAKALESQQQTGQPSEWGEIIAEGAYSGPNDYEKLAKASLPNLANAVRIPYNRDFWRRFALVETDQYQARDLGKYL